MNQIYSALLSLVAGYFILVSPSQHAYAEDIQFAVGEYSPLVTTAREDLGITSVFIKEACRLAGLEPKFEFFSWNKAAYALETGKFHASYPWRITDERKQRFIFSETPISQTHTAVFYMADTLDSVPTWTTFTQLQNFGLVGVKSYWYEPELTQMGKHAFLARDAQHAWKILKAGRMKLLADTYIAGYEEAKATLTDSELKNLRFKISSQPPVPGFVIYSKQWQDSTNIRDRLEKAYKQLHENGTFDALYNPKMGSQP